MNPSSFTSASTFPTKLLQPSVCCSITEWGSIYPIHIQLNPTNKCNLKCKFCSCMNKDDHEMPVEQAYTVLYRFQKLGARAVTITGGGEPLMHSGINDIIRSCETVGHVGMEVGLVTNGILLDRLDSTLKIRWCRISVSGEHLINSAAKDKILSMPHVDWAMSYVLQEHNYATLTNAIIIANELGLKHVRVVDDILSNKTFIEHAKYIVQSHGIDTSRVIWQGRKEYTKGCIKCLISLIKPNIDAHGNVYPCCGVQYAQEKPSLNFSKEYCMGDDYEAIWQQQAYFDGSVCDKCYYCSYNNLLGSMIETSSIEHGAFI